MYLNFKISNFKNGLNGNFSNNADGTIAIPDF
jgi:hypothetical protein